MAETSYRGQPPTGNRKDDRKSAPAMPSDPGFLDRRSMLSRIGVLTAGLLSGSALARVLDPDPAHAVTDSDPHDAAGAGRSSRSGYSDSDPHDAAGAGRGGSRSSGYESNISDSDRFDAVGFGFTSDSDRFDAVGFGFISDSDPFDAVGFGRGR